MVNSGWATEEIDGFIINNYISIPLKEILRQINNDFAVNINLHNLKDRITRLKKLGKITINKQDLMRYNEEQIEWLKNRTINYDFTYKQLAKEFNDKFNQNKSVITLETFCKHKFKLDKYMEKKRIYTNAQQEWLKENFSKYINKELTDKFNAHFKTSRSVNGIFIQCKKLGLKNNNPKTIYFEKGYKKTQKSLGSESIKRGVVRVKTGDGKNGWKLKHELLWKKYHNAEIPENHIIIFADGNKRNFDKDNLICVDRSTQACISNYHDCSPELKRLKIVSFKLNKILSELEI